MWSESNNAITKERGIITDRIKGTVTIIVFDKNTQIKKGVEVRSKRVWS